MAVSASAIQSTRARRQWHASLARLHGDTRTQNSKAEEYAMEEGVYVPRMRYCAKFIYLPLASSASCGIAGADFHIPQMRYCQHIFKEP